METFLPVLLNLPTRSIDSWVTGAQRKSKRLCLDSPKKVERRGTVGTIRGDVYSLRTVTGTSPGLTPGSRLGSVLNGERRRTSYFSTFCLRVVSRSLSNLGLSVSCVRFRIQSFAT